MSKGPGRIERRVADFLAASHDRVLTIDAIADNAYELGGRRASRAQRLAATRALHGVLARVPVAIAKAAARGAGPRPAPEYNTADDDDEAYERLTAHPAWRKADALWDACERIGYWNRIVAVEGQPDQHRV